MTKPMNMNALAKTLDNMILKHRTAGMAEKLSKLFAYDQLTAEEYTYLMGCLPVI